MSSFEEKRDAAVATGATLGALAGVVVFPPMGLLFLPGIIGAAVSGAFAGAVVSAASKDRD